MNIVKHNDASEMGRAAARQGLDAITHAIATTDRAVIIVATGTSQFPMLEHLVHADIDWAKVTVFHLDEYVGLSRSHPASFRRYLHERVVEQLLDLAEFVMVEGDAADLRAEIARLNDRLGREHADVCFAGIGENCHLAFNDPPADFVTDAPYIVVTLDEACRRQQLGEGWFENLDAVPRQAVSMSIRQIMKSRKIILSVPDARKAEAVRRAVEEPVTNLFPASILQQHADTTLHLDVAAASLLT